MILSSPTMQPTTGQNQIVFFFIIQQNIVFLNTISKKLFSLFQTTALQIVFRQKKTNQDIH